MIAKMFVLALTAGGCATGAARGGAMEGERGGGGLVVEVDNTLVPTTELTVYLVSESGSRALVGSAPPNRSTTLRVRNPSVGGEYRLLARFATGRQLLSNPFLLSEGDAVRWNLPANVAVVVD
jgi:hypothetical protein